MSNLVMWNLLIGFLMPTVVAAIQQPKFSSPVRAGITFVAALIGGFLTAYFNDQFNFGDVVGSILVTGVSAITFYKGFWKPTGIAPGIENVTSPGSQPPAELLHPDDAPRPDERGAVDVTQVLIVAILAVVLLICIFVLTGEVRFR